MPSHCVVAGCSKTNKDGVSLHYFPRDEHLRRVWTARVKMTRAMWRGPGLVGSRSAVICCDHFPENNFEESLHSQFGFCRKRRLKPDAIPIIKPPRKDWDAEKEKKNVRDAAEKRKKSRNNIMGRICAIIGCSNSVEKLSHWYGQICQLHGKKNGSCICLPPFQLLPFPYERKNPERRKSWIKLVNRKTKSGKNWQPKSHDRICSRHFKESEPTASWPNPTENMGYNLQSSTAKSPRQPPKERPAQSDSLHVQSVLEEPALDEPVPVTVSNSTSSSFPTLPSTSTTVYQNTKEMSDDGNGTENSQDDASQDQEEDSSRESYAEDDDLSRHRPGYHQQVKNRRSVRRCEECEACQRKTDCGKCDFCLDKPQFGGPNKRRQKCRLKQCLRICERLYLKQNWKQKMMEGGSSGESKRRGTQKKSTMTEHDYAYPWTPVGPSSKELETEEEIGQGIKKLMEVLHEEEEEKQKQPENEDMEHSESTSAVKEFIMDAESWTVMSASSGSEDDYHDDGDVGDDDRSSLYLSSSSSSSSSYSSSSSSSTSSSPPISPVQSPQRETPSPSPSGNAVLPERRAKVHTLVNMMDKMSKGKGSRKEKAEERDSEERDSEDRESEDDGNAPFVFCLCRSTDYSQFIISCDYCAKMYHGKCVGVEPLAAKFILKYACPPCRDENPTLTVFYKERLGHPGTESRLNLNLNLSEETEDAEEGPNIEKRQEEMKPRRRRRKIITCGKCPACARTEDCGKCMYCKDKTKFGGAGIKKQKCCRRKCPKGVKQPLKSNDKPNIQNSGLDKKYINPYQTILYDTSKIPDPELRKHVSHELKFHHDYALQPTRTTSWKKDKDVEEKEEKAESATNTNQPKKQIKKLIFKKMTMSLEKKRKRKKRRQKCGWCIPCRRVQDCEECVYCKDKKKNGGEAKLRQKCRLRQCKHKGFSSEKKQALKSIPWICGGCVACRTVTNCGDCKNCRDKVANGGPSLWRQKCLFKQCLLKKFHPEHKCGSCEGCMKTSNCERCVPCRENQKFRRRKKVKCQRRRCRNAEHPDHKCGSCEGCKKTSNCERCNPCRKNRKFQVQRKQECNLRRCLNSDTPMPAMVRVDWSDSDSSDTTSKDCEDDRALKSSTSRIFEAFPEQIKKWKQDSNFAQEKGIDWEKLESSLKEIKLNLAHIDSKMIELKEIIAMPKTPASIDANRQTKKQTSETCTRGPQIVRESKLCDHLVAQQNTSVMKLRMMYHGSNQEPKVTMREVCGCPLELDILTDTDEYCPLYKTNCETHYNWEKLKQAELDLERVVWLLKLDELLDVGKGTQ